LWGGFLLHKGSRFRFVGVEKGAYWGHGREQRGGLRDCGGHCETETETGAYRKGRVEGMVENREGSLETEGPL